MDIPNLSQNSTTQSFSSTPSKKPKKIKIGFIIILILAIGSGFVLSRILPLNNSGNSVIDVVTNNTVTSIDNVTSADQLEVGKYYGDSDKTFTDTATGTLVAGGINGEGTHTLQREGGKTQYAALTSSTVDLDLFVGKKVEIKGETNTSKKAGWFLDVGAIKILE